MSRRKTKGSSAKASLDWSFKGMKTLILENSLLKVSILLDKGSDIFEVIYKPLDIDLIWHSPIGYRNPIGYVQDNTSAADIFHDFYGGGWNDIFPNYGNPSQNRGARFAGHGESALLPWSCNNNCKGEEEVDGIVSANLSVDCVRYPIRAEKKVTLDSSKALFTVSEDIINLSEQPLEVSWAQHIAYGEPFVSEDLEIDISASNARTHAFDVPYSRIAKGKEFDWPHAPALDGRSTVDLAKVPPRNEQVQEDFPITGLKSHEYKLYNPKLDVGVQVVWNREAFPILWYWLSWGTPDYPFFGRSRTLALEPTTSSTGNGLADDIKDGSAKVLSPGSKLHGDVTMKVFSSLNRS